MSNNKASRYYPTKKSSFRRGLGKIVIIVGSRFLKQFESRALYIITAKRAASF